ncbi:MAG: SiaB family protein kinase [Bacteroidales bacterium]|nr:SiaB family protein kinase [Bacteroidales bacterium]
MAQELTNNLFDIAFQLFNRVGDRDFEYVYKGYFDHDITKKILFLADSSIGRLTGFSQATLQKRIYYIMVEGLQNITHHQDEVANEPSFDKYPPVFAIQKYGDRYYISTGNIIANPNIDPLKVKLERINSMDQEELKKFHRDMLRNGSISDKGGAGLGLIEMSRKSGNKLLYSFVHLDDDYSYFYMQTLIPTDANFGVADMDNGQAFSSLENVKTLHSHMNKENLSLMFNGFFNQENLLSLLSIIKSRPNLPLTTIKISNVMVEMIQNIIKHGSKLSEDQVGVPGVFFLGQTGDETHLTAANLVQAGAAESISSNIEYLNGLDREQVSDLYDQILLDFAAETSAKKTGLGLSDLRIKSDRPLKYQFRDAQVGDSKFYILQTSIKTKK